MAARKDRIKSAQPRINQATAALNAEEAERIKELEEPISRLSSSRRVQSARERKMSQESSRIFPDELTSTSQTGGRWKTIYSEDFESKGNTRPPTARPTSATRRNNPHPRQTFMNWRLPSRRLSKDEDEIDAYLLKTRLEEFNQDVSETFQKDYKDSRNDGNACNEVLTTLAKLPLPLSEPVSREYGRRLSQPSPGKLPAMPRRIEVQPAVDASAESTQPKQTVSEEAVKTTVKSDHIPAVDDWLKKANKREQKVVYNMLRSAEDAQLEQAVSRTLQPHTIPAVQQWLKEAKPEDRSVAASLLNAVSPPPSARPPSRAKQQRRASMPVGFVPKSTSQAAANQLYRRHSMPEHLSDPKKKPPAAVWHLDPFRNNRPTVVHQGSVFGSAPKYRGSHYVIHPEWPEYV